ncbi:hypothetical protein BLOT_011882 [Blomia tropicalis]|nr:hypothetical protein BLOT_011882 [Blomia tropicalis]
MKNDQGENWDSKGRSLAKGMTPGAGVDLRIASIWSNGTVLPLPNVIVIGLVCHYKTFQFRPRTP